MNGIRADLRDDRSWDAVGAPHPGVRHPRARRPGQWSALTDGLIIAFAGLLVLVAIWSAWSASPVGRVRGWSPWRSDANGVTLEYPIGWGVHDFSASGVGHFVFGPSEWVRVHLIVGPQEVWGVPRGAFVEGDYRLPRALHDDTRELWSRLLGPMREGRAAGTVLAGRPAVWSRFDCWAGPLEGSGQPMTGFRAALAAGGQVVLVAAVAPTADWDEFRPIALHVLRSLRVGAQPG